MVHLLITQQTNANQIALMLFISMLTQYQDNVLFNAN